MQPVELPTREKALIDEVLSSDPDVRYCGIIDKNGNLTAGKMKKGVKSLEPASEDPKLALLLAILRATDQGWNAYLSETDYFLIRKKRINLLLYPIKDSKGILVSTEPAFSTEGMQDLRNLLDRRA